MSHICLTGRIERKEAAAHRTAAYRIYSLLSQGVEEYQSLALPLILMFVSKFSSVIILKICLSALLSMNDRMHKITICHPERPKIIADYRRESKDLRTKLRANIRSVRRFFDSADAPLRMTELSVRVFCVLAESSR